MGHKLFQCFIIIGVINFAYSQWNPPYFSDAGTAGIKFENVVNDFTIINVDEEIPVPFLLAIINYEGSSEPRIELEVGDNKNLGADFVKNGNKWAIQINQRQDYETISVPTYSFKVHIDIDDTEETNKVQINLQNILDTLPTLSYNSPCEAEELHSDYDTGCIFWVYHPDLLLTKDDLIISITGSYGEEEIFEFRNPVQASAYIQNYTLFLKQEVRYEDKALYNFETTVQDAAKNEASVTTLVRIIDIPSLPPTWTKPFSSARIDEKTPWETDVVAIDGDTQLNVPICYEVRFNEDQDYSDIISVGTETGILKLEPINRDERKQEVFPFDLIAYKCYNASWSISSMATIIVDDINDNFPEITIGPLTIEVKEETSLNLDFTVFFVEDIDLGRHATYTVTLEDKIGDIVYSEAFNVIPNTGYQAANFTITVVNASLLDYEERDWQSFSLIIASEEIDEPEHKRTQEISINLLNWNDEIPEFENSEFYIEVPENIGADEILVITTASDKDIGDAVVHSIAGNSGLHINPETGEIKTISENTFDYERQTIVVLQLLAKDSLQLMGEPLHTTFASLTINITDVNDETPDIKLPRTSPSLLENVPPNTIVNQGIDIIATDPDTTANLVFDIDWDETYATKSGQLADRRTFENCFIIDKEEITRNEVHAILKVNPDFEYDIDYEMYETIYIRIIVTDQNQEINQATTEATLTVRIEDENDNAPEFILNTLEVSRSVVEESLTGTVIGTIYAEDIDGPEYNKFTYTLVEQNDTLPDLVTIDSDNGLLTVKLNEEIDCGFPPIEYLFYTVVLDDGLNENYGDIKIFIHDINNKSPKLGEFNNIIEIYENATTDDELVQVIANDEDRDAPYNILKYIISYSTFPDLEKYFGINITTGLLSVMLLGNNKLDRDHGIDSHAIHIEISDNYQGNGRTNQISTIVNVILLDVNDNAPEMPEPTAFMPIISENSDIGTQLGDDFVAPDIDQPETPNSEVIYEIIAIEAGGDNAVPMPVDVENLFVIENVSNKYCKIKTKKLLKGYYGKWKITLRASDNGHLYNSVLQMSSEETYEITITPHNFNSPSIVFPERNKAIRLNYHNQIIGATLIMVDNSELPLLTAEDDDGGIYGEVTFQLTSANNDDDADYFTIREIRENPKQAQLILYKEFQQKTYYVNLKAIDGGGLEDELTRLEIVFVDVTGDPYFVDIDEFQAEFHENTTGLMESQFLQEAHDPKNDGIENPADKFPIYYFIDYSYNPESAEYFALNKENNELTLVDELDREEIDKHTIQIIATNNINGPVNPKSTSQLRIHITVLDVNDNPPEFDYSEYGAGITPNDYKGKVVLSVKATDPDLDDEVNYRRLDETLETTGENLHEIIASSFQVNSRTGEVSLNIEVKATMKGFIEFDIEAIDLVGHTDQTHVKIYIIAESNRITFIFINSVEDIMNKVDFIASTFKEYYQYDCNIDDVTPDESEDTRETYRTRVRTHFINNNEAIEAAEILSRSNDIALISGLKLALSAEGLLLNDVPNGSQLEEQDMEMILLICLILVSIVLGGLCIALIVLYFIKTIRLKRQLKALSTTDYIFGSNASGLNRREVPTTNIFSVEGSNPVITNNGNMRRITDLYDSNSLTSSSDDSQDFYGVDKDPTFMRNNANYDDYENEYSTEKDDRDSRRSYDCNDEDRIKF